MFPSVLSIDNFLRRARLGENGEVVSDGRFEDNMLQGEANNYLLI